MVSGFFSCNVKSGYKKLDFALGMHNDNDVADQTSKCHFNKPFWSLIGVDLTHE